MNRLTQLGIPLLLSFGISACGTTAPAEDARAAPAPEVVEQVDEESVVPSDEAPLEEESKIKSSLIWPTLRAKTRPPFR